METPPDYRNVEQQFRFHCHIELLGNDKDKRAHINYTMSFNSLYAATQYLNDLNKTTNGPHIIHMRLLTNG